MSPSYLSTKIDRTSSQNVFDSGSAEIWISNLIQLLPSDNVHPILRGSAVRLLSTLIPLLLTLRDQGELRLSIDAFRKALSIEECLDLACRDDIPNDLRNALKGFLQSIGGDPDLTLYRQPPIFVELYGGAKVCISKALANLETILDTSPTRH